MYSQFSVPPAGADSGCWKRGGDGAQVVEKRQNSLVWDPGEELGLCQGMGSQGESPCGIMQALPAPLTQHRDADKGSDKGSDKDNKAPG